jgi:hypothetical protein
MLVRRRGNRLPLAALARRHEELPQVAAEPTSVLGGAQWEPPHAARELESRLRSCVNGPGVVELVLFGSQARGGTTAFSDVDAILVIEDATAEDPAALSALRGSVLAAQRAVVAYQPMQHHGFEVATPKLLGRGRDSLGIPAVALTETRSLRGNAIEAMFEPVPAAESRKRLTELLRNTAVSAWPRHAWRLHGLVSMFELLPALYLQARGREIPKWRSFDEAHSDFGDAWWPYDVLREVRDVWPRTSSVTLRAGIAGLRNPWAAVAAWSRLPSPEAPEAVRRLLSQECLAALRELARDMEEKAR